MPKIIHEIRDPLHNFIRLNNDERAVLDSRPLQRLRHIHQLALTFQVYPGASHKRFEHSLGVMELASRVFDVITNPHNVTDRIRALLPELKDPEKLTYWRRVLRMAALCHDIGHLPYSHAAEHRLLDSGTKHEHFTKKMGIISLTMQRSSALRGTAPCRLPDCFDCVFLDGSTRRGMPLRRARSRGIPGSLPIRRRAGCAAFGRRLFRDGRVRRLRSRRRAAAFLSPREEPFGNARRVGVHWRQGRFPAHGGSFPQSAISSR